MELVLKNTPEDKQRVAPAIAEFSSQHGLPPKVTEAFDLALEEHLTNILNYGYRDKAAHEILVRMTFKSPWAQIEVEDDGIPFNPLARPEVDTSRPLDEKPIGGLGIHMIRKSMDELAYRREGERNILTFRKRSG